MASTHALVRTNEKGAPGIFRCINCGKTDLPANAALWECENSPRKPAMSAETCVPGRHRCERPELRAELVAKDVRIAELELRLINSYSADQLKIAVDYALFTSRAEIETLRKRVRELEAHNTRGAEIISRLEQRDGLHLARAEQAEAQLAVMREALESIVTWWSILPNGRYSPMEIQVWLNRLSKAVMDKASAALQQTSPTPSAIEAGFEEVKARINDGERNHAEASRPPPGPNFRKW